MPELPDITVYLEALERRVVGRVLEKIRIEAFFVLRTAVPPIDALAGRKSSRCVGWGSGARSGLRPAAGSCCT